MPHTNQALLSTEFKLAAAIDELTEHIVLFDPDDRIILANKAWRKLNKPIAEFTLPGTLFEDHLRAAIKAGLIPAALGQEQRWLDERMARHRNPDGPFELERQDGCWVLVNEQRLPNGTLILTVSDITDQKKVANRFRESEERFTAFINNLPAKMNIKDAQGRYTMINPVSEHLFGMKADKVLGKTSTDIFPEKMSEIFGFDDQQVLHSGKAITTEEEFPTTDGTRTYLTIKFPIRDAQGIINAVGATGIDITERKLAERALQNAHRELEQRVEQRTRQLEMEINQRKQIAENLKTSEERFRDIAASSSDWFWEMGPDLRFSYIDESFSRMANVDLKQYLGKTREEISADGVDKQTLNKHLNDLAHHHPFRNFQYELQRSDGQILHLSISGTPVFDSYGNFKGYRGAGTNVTAQVESEKRAQLAQEALQYAKDEAEKANQTKTQFLSSMSHELRTPLNAILGFAQLLEHDKQTPLTPTQRENVQYIIDGGKHLLHLIADVLAFNKIEAGQIAFNPEMVSIHKIIEDCISQLQIKASDHNIQIINNGNDFPHLLIETDTVRTKQVLFNILDNAIKYNRPDGTVTISCSIVDSRYLRINIKDQGRGIPTGRENDVYTPFNRLGRESGNIEGTGIGLTIAKRIIEMLNGRIGFTSKKNQGCNFWIDIPTTRPGQLSAVPGEAPSHAPAATQHRTQNDFTVLYVEDSQTNMKLMEIILSKQPDIRMLAAGNAETGLELAARHLPDLILMDINLPGMSGLEALQQLKKMPATERIPVIAISADAMPRDIQSALAAGFCDYITKPIDVAKTQQIINTFLGQG